jgi:2'-5' RNA ligase
VPPPKRLFVGLELPASYKTVLSELDPHLAGLRWLPKEQLHLTLSFLGDVEASWGDRLHQTLSQVRVPPFFIPLHGVGFFSSRGTPSVVWVGVGKGHPHLFALHRHIQDAVTVGRAEGISGQALQPFIRSHAQTEFGLFKVTGFELYSSALSSAGAAYRVEMHQEF